MLLLLLLQGCGCCGLKRWLLASLLPRWQSNPRRLVQHRPLGCMLCAASHPWLRAIS